MQPCGPDPWRMTRRVRGGFCRSTFKRSAELGEAKTVVYVCSLIAPNTTGGNKPCKMRTIHWREGNMFCRVEISTSTLGLERMVVDGSNVSRSYAGAPSPTVRVLAVGTERSFHANQATACVLPLWLASCSVRVPIILSIFYSSAAGKSGWARRGSPGARGYCTPVPRLTHAAQRSQQLQYVILACSIPSRSPNSLCHYHVHPACTQS